MLGVLSGGNLPSTAAIRYNQQQTSWNVTGNAYTLRGDPRLAADVLQFQVLANAEGAGLTPDGKLGPATIEVIQNALNFGWPESNQAQGIARKIAQNTSGVATVPPPAPARPASPAPAQRAPARQSSARRRTPPKPRKATVWGGQVSRGQARGAARSLGQRYRVHAYEAQEAAKRNPWTPAYAGEQQRLLLEAQRQAQLAINRRRLWWGGGLVATALTYMWWKSRPA